MNFAIMSCDKADKGCHRLRTRRPKIEGKDKLKTNSPIEAKREAFSRMGNYSDMASYSGSALFFDQI